MRLRSSGAWTFIVVGGIAFLLLQFHFMLAWHGYYSKTIDGDYPAFFTTSPQSLRIGRVILFLLPLVALWFTTGWSRLKAALGLWAGVMLAAILIWLSTKRLREDSDLWPFDLAYVGFQTAVPLLFGTVAQLALQGCLWLASFRRRKDRFA